MVRKGKEERTSQEEKGGAFHESSKKAKRGNLILCEIRKQIEIRFELSGTGEDSNNLLEKLDGGQKTKE